jgi:hypothetical protein
MHALVSVVFLVLQSFHHPLVTAVIFLAPFVIVGVVYAFKRYRDR